MAADFSTLETRLGCTFSDERLLQQAFVHRSYLNEHPDTTLESYERLEFLGDAVLGLITADYLYRTYPTRPESELTPLRASVINKNMLAALAEELGFGDHLSLSRGQKNSVSGRASILADTFEAVLGALYLDQGYAAAAAFVGRVLLPKVAEIVAAEGWRDPKSILQETAQERTGVMPVYKILKETGPDHRKHFIVGVFLGEQELGRGEGFSKQNAEQAAASAALVATGWDS